MFYRGAMGRYKVEIKEYKAESALIEAAGIVATIDYNPEALEVARRLSQNVKLIGNTIKAKKVSDDEDF